jgi:hypothetical protein
LIFFFLRPTIEERDIKALLGKNYGATVIYDSFVQCNLRIMKNRKTLIYENEKVKMLVAFKA